MKTLTTILTLTTFTILACSSKTALQDDFETEICECIYDKYDSIGIDLKSELLKYEQHLIDNDFLEDTTGQSYIQIFKTIAKENDVSITTDYSIDSLSPQTFVLYAKCFYSKKDDLSLINSNSKIKRLYSAYDSIATSGNINPSKVASALLTVLDADDFDKEFYRIYALYTFYFTANPTPGFDKHSRLDDKPAIELTITADQQIYLDNTPTPLDSVGAKIIKLTKDFSEDELSNYVIRLIVDTEVKMGLLSDVKQQLQEAKALRIKYETK